jgi:hypothetical protein
MFRIDHPDDANILVAVRLKLADKRLLHVEAQENILLPSDAILIGGR